MFKTPLTYTCILFFIICMGMSSAYAKPLEAEAIYCDVRSSRHKEARGFMEYIKETLSCKVKVEYEIEEYNGDVTVEVTYENTENLLEKFRDLFNKE